MEYKIFDLFTLGISVYWILYYRKLIFSSYSHIIYLLFFVFYIFPLAVDYLYMIPDYTSNLFAGFRMSSIDSYTRIIYDIFILVTQYAMIRFMKKRKDGNDDYSFLSPITATNLNKFLYIGMVIPAFLTIFHLRMPYMLYTPFWREMELLNIHRHYYYVETFTYLGIVCSSLLLFDRNNPKLTRLSAILFLCINICCQGKRAALFFAFVTIVVILYDYFIRKIRYNRNSILYLLIFGTITLIAIEFMVSMTFSVQANRGVNEELSSLVEMARIDFLRDDRVRMAIYSELYPEKMHILDYYGQTIYSNILSIWPLNFFMQMIGFEYYNYQPYLTSALYLSNFDPDNNYMTPSMFAELISNFGLVVSLILFSWINILFIKIVRRNAYPLNVLFLISYVLLNLFSFSYIIIVLEFTVILYIHRRRKLRIN